MSEANLGVETNPTSLNNESVQFRIVPLDQHSSNPGESGGHCGNVRSQAEHYRKTFPPLLVGGFVSQ